MPPLGPRLYLGGTSSAEMAEWKCDCALLHDLVVVYRVSDVNVGLVRDVRYRGVEVEDIRGSGRCQGVQMGIQPVHESRFARASHSNGDDADWFLGLCHGRRSVTCVT